jgi:hypothetical protein
MLAQIIVAITNIAGAEDMIPIRRDKNKRAELLVDE